MMDLRDVSYDLVHWGEDEYFLVYLAADTVALLPVVGVIKYFDFKNTNKTVDAIKQVGNVTDATKNAGKVADVANNIIDTNKHSKTIGEAIKNVKEKQLTTFSKAKAKYVRYVYKPTINQRYKGKVHPAGVKFSEKKLKYSNGVRELRVVPEFNFIYEIKLDKSLYMGSREEHFNYCNEQLQKAIKNDPNLKSKFNTEQIKEIETGKISGAPTGYTWHHNEREGVLQLVDSKIHQEVGHTGGYSMWGAGSIKDAA